jgi:hypothetical protein
MSSRANKKVNPIERVLNLLTLLSRADAPMLAVSRRIPPTKIHSVSCLPATRT